MKGRRTFFYHGTTLLEVQSIGTGTVPTETKTKKNILRPAHSFLTSNKKMIIQVPGNWLPGSYGTQVGTYLPKSLGERLCLAHLQRVDLAAGHGGEGCVGAEGLGHAHGDGRLAGAGDAGNEDGPARNLALLHHFYNDAGGPPCRHLPHHALGTNQRRIFWCKTA